MRLLRERADGYKKETKQTTKTALLKCTAELVEYMKAEEPVYKIEAAEQGHIKKNAVATALENSSNQAEGTTHATWETPLNAFAEYCDSFYSLVNAKDAERDAQIIQARKSKPKTARSSPDDSGD
ncbi:hypothetical protein AGMMS49949_07070 [Alphaproteobacteria bacterium]|nr:hypothetical protein AGMMS49949_07070 [Alphaproteobacteria bacterium]GHS98406.1 hypothetical protein AGMMS50296_6050 [Alphaproteobacteria bacterium]